MTREEAEPVFSLVRAALTRRSLLVGSLGLLAVGAEGIISGTPAQADAPLSFDQVRAMALSVVSQTLSGVKASLGVTGPWASFHGEWCAWFVTWLLHNNGIGYEVDAEDPYDTYAKLGRVGTTPTVGSLIFFGAPAAHVGLVIGVSSSGCETVEGNAGSNPWPSSVVHHNIGRIGTRYAYPVYSAWDTSPTTPPTGQSGMDEEMGRLVHHPNGSVAFAATDGTFTVLTTMDQVNALVATGACPAEMINLPDPFIWNLRLDIAQMRKAQNEI